MGSVFWPIQFQFPVCRLGWLLYTFLSGPIDDRDLIFGHKLHIVGSVFGPIRFLLPVFIHIEHAFCICPFFSATIAEFENCVWHDQQNLGRFCNRKLKRTDIFFTRTTKPMCNFANSAIDGRNLILGHKLFIGTPYRGKRILTRRIPTSYLPKSGGIVS